MTLIVDNLFWYSYIIEERKVSSMKMQGKHRKTKQSIVKLKS